MLQDIGEMLGGRIGSSIDFIETKQAQHVVRAALEAARKLLDASVAEVYCLVPDARIVSATFSVEKTRVFRRFASVSIDQMQKSKRYQSDDYNPIEIKGYWTWVFRENAPVWVENCKERTTDEGKIVENRVPGSKNVPSEHNVVDEYIQSLIVVPFEHKIEQSGGLWGLLTIEFCHPTQYNQERYEALLVLADHIASIIWKSRAWEENRKGTEAVVAHFAKWCEESAKHAAMPHKTGLFVQSGSQPRPIYKRLEQSFHETGIRMDFYDAVRMRAHLEETRGLGILDIIKKEHFGVVDLTRHEQTPNVLLVLGFLMSRDLPCLVLHDSAHTEEIPPLLVMMAASTGGNHPVLHSYRYDLDKDEFCEASGIMRRWDQIWKDFLKSVRERSTSFRIAHDWVERGD